MTYIQTLEDEMAVLTSEYFKLKNTHHGYPSMIPLYRLMVEALYAKTMAALEYYCYHPTIGFDWITWGMRLHSLNGELESLSK